jgi:RHS repeat-associated protein
MTAGNVQSRTATTHAAAYAYDALDRLTAQTDTATTAYTYDPSGNRLSADHAGTLHPYTYQPQSNRLATLDGQALTHDPAGHLTQDAQGRTHTYNQAGRLTAVHQGATLIAAYTYGADGRRSHKRVGAAVTVFLYDPDGRLLAEARADGTPIRDYLWHDDVPVAQIDAMGTDTLTYLHPDHLGTPRLGTDATATPVWRWEGDAFGASPPDEDPDANGQSTTVHLRFPGQYFDAETGRHENWFRYYDPKLGRYVTSDPIGLDGGLNTYLYANANPLTYADPEGLEAVIPWPGPAAGAGAGAAGAGGLAAGAAVAGAGLAGYGIGSLIYPHIEPTITRAVDYCLSDDDETDDNCEALYQSILSTCAGLSGRKKFRCFEAARIARDQCYAERGR